MNEVTPPHELSTPIGTALWTLEDGRERTLEALAGTTDDDVDAVAPGFPNTIGATLYHIAAIEADWLYADLVGGDYPNWLGDWFPFDVREDDGRLSPAPGFPLSNHLERLAFVRARFVEELRRFDRDAWRRSNGLAENPSTPEWILHHLTQHEAEHRGQLQAIRTLLAR